MTGFEAYRLFLSIQLHFNNDQYDFIKYGGNVNASKDAFECRKDKLNFYKLSRKYNYEELKNFLVSNFVYRDIGRSYDLMRDEADKIYKEWLKNTQSINYVFNQDINYLSEKTLRGLIRVPKNKDPELLINYYKGYTRLETLLIMHLILDFIPYWEKKINDKILFPHNLKRWKKYLRFMTHIDLPKYEQVLKDKFLDFPDKKA